MEIDIIISWKEEAPDLEQICKKICKKALEGTEEAEASLDIYELKFSKKIAYATLTVKGSFELSTILERLKELEGVEFYGWAG